MSDEEKDIFERVVENPLAQGIGVLTISLTLLFVDPMTKEPDLLMSLYQALNDHPYTTQSYSPSYQGPK